MTLVRMHGFHGCMIGISCLSMLKSHRAIAVFLRIGERGRVLALHAGKAGARQRALVDVDALVSRSVPGHGGGGVEHTLVSYAHVSVSV